VLKVTHHEFLGGGSPPSLDPLDVSIMKMVCGNITTGNPWNCARAAYACSEWNGVTCTADGNNIYNIR